MGIVFAAAVSHAPGITAWTDAAPVKQKDALYSGFERLNKELAESGAESLIVISSEHWANFFLDHVSACCVGRADSYKGPIEPWLKIDAMQLVGDVELADTLLHAAYADGVEPGFSYELKLDHGTIVPLHFLSPQSNIPIVPVLFNALTEPQPSARRSLDFGRIIGRVAEKSRKRIGIVAAGGMSHDPGERNHGVIDSEFDRSFLSAMVACDTKKLGGYSQQDLASAGAGAFELLTWIALAGAVEGARGEVIAYEAVEPWATGMGLMRYEMAHARST